MGESEQIIDFSRLKAACSRCNLQELCLPRGLSAPDLARLDHVVKGACPVQKGGYIFSVGDRFEAFYAVRSGSVKVSVINAAGEEQITGFYFPGEILGFDAIDRRRHNCSARALEISTFCALPYEKIHEICVQIPDLQNQIFRLMSRELSIENKLLLTLNKRTAEERIAIFLVNLSSRFRRLGYSGREYNLPMSRQEIGDYLGLTIETVSRLFKRFQRDGLIQLDKKAIRLEDLPALHALCDGAGHGAAPGRNHVA